MFIIVMVKIPVKFYEGGDVIRELRYDLAHIITTDPAEIISYFVHDLNLLNKALYKKFGLPEDFTAIEIEVEGFKYTYYCIVTYNPKVTLLNQNHPVI